MFGAAYLTWLRLWLIRASCLFMCPVVPVVLFWTGCMYAPIPETICFLLSIGFISTAGFIALGMFSSLWGKFLRLFQFCAWVLISLLLVSSERAPKNLVLDRPDVRQAIQKAWAKTEARTDGTEYCFTVSPSNIISYTGIPYSCTMTVYPQTIATVHTHPLWSAVEPSARDRQDAVETKIPFYVISKHQVWAALPDGSAAFVSYR